MLGDRELKRYDRQIIMPDWGKAGQEKLRNSKVQVAGAGGLGSAVLTYLAVAGIGVIRIIDGDKVEIGNLNRQTLHTDNDIGRLKIDSARERLESLNPDIQIEVAAEVITEENGYTLLDDCPIVDALDNLPSRYILNKVAVSRKLPLFHGAVYGLEGRATTIMPGRTPCLECLYQAVMPGKIPVVGVTPAVIGSIQATEVIKYLLGIGELLYNRLLIYDGLSMSFSEVGVKVNPTCTVCSSCS